MLSETRDPHTTWLTQEAFDRLQAELSELTGPAREAVVERIASAREEGDLRENGGYHAAKEEQGKLEARIRQIQEILRIARVGEPPAARGGMVAPGTLVTVRFDGDDESETFLLGSREESGGEYAVYSPSSPIGAAVSGHSVGDVVEYVAPRGTQKVEILKVEPYQR